MAANLEKGQFGVNQNLQKFIKNFNGSPQILRPISAPPQGVYENRFEENLPSSDVLNNPDYYYYYYSMKPLDPRLPKPLYRPPTHGKKLRTIFDQIQIHEIQEKLRGEEECSRVGEGKENEGPQNQVQCIEKLAEKQVEVPVKTNKFIAAKKLNAGPAPAFQIKAFEPVALGQSTRINQPAQYQPQSQTQYSVFGRRVTMNSGAYYPQGAQPSQYPVNPYGYGYVLYPGIQQAQYQIPAVPHIAPGYDNFYYGGSSSGQQVHEQPRSGIGKSEDYAGRSFERCRDSQGSRVIQQIFEDGDEAEKERVFESIVHGADELMKDVFGNYVIQKIIEKGGMPQKERVYTIISGKLVELAGNTYGCRVVQKAFDEAKANGEHKFLVQLVGGLRGHIMDGNGNHVVQKCFEALPISELEFIVREVEANIEALASDPCGCRVIQKILEFSDPSSPRLGNIYKRLLKSIEDLAYSPYGNYIIQHVMLKGPENERDKVYKFTLDNFWSLSQNKFASNITEKAITYGNDYFRRDVLSSLIRAIDSSTREPILLTLMKHEFGNYVTQKLVETSTKDMRKSIRKVLDHANLEALRANPYSKHVLNLLEKHHDAGHKYYAH